MPVVVHGRGGRGGRGRGAHDGRGGGRCGGSHDGRGGGRGGGDYRCGSGIDGTVGRENGTTKEQYPTPDIIQTTIIVQHKNANNHTTHHTPHT